MAAFYDSPRGEAYEWLIDYATERSDMFMVAFADVPAELRELKKLRWLSLSRNRLASAPAVIDELPQLEYVDLDDNLYNPRSTDWNS